MFRSLTRKNDFKVVSYDRLQLYIGVLAFAMPLIMVYGSKILTGCDEPLDSLSAYYHTDMRNWFVGILAAVAFFLYSYNGEEVRDTISGVIAATAALMVAFFPTTLCDNFSENCQKTGYHLSNLNESNCTTICEPEIYSNSILHFSGAGIFFLTLIYFSFFLFVKSNTPKDQWSRTKWTSYWIHKVCGGIMIFVVMLIPINAFIVKDLFEGTNYILIIEWIALWAFGVSWFTKSLSSRQKIIALRKQMIK